MGMSLSIIIPFLNEGKEVENTIISIMAYTNRSVEIILINDASDDDFNYQVIAEKYNVKYIINKERIGVAASRDKGVLLCNSPYFLLLDAHMRFYDFRWVDLITDQLKKDDRVVLCCQTKVLSVNNGLVQENSNLDRTYYGAYIDFNNINNLLGAKWTNFEYPNQITRNIVPIACVLGAGYACSKRYWLYLKGLNGLLYYGSDESYLSLKVWLEGGKCLLLKDVVIGHVYRNQFPYSVLNLYTLYNRMLIAVLLLPNSYAKQVFSVTKYQYLLLYNEIIKLLYKNKESIYELKTYYRQILNKDFRDFLKFNNLACQNKEIIPNVDDVLRDMVYKLIIKGCLNNSIGIIDGRMSIVIFLYHYAHYTNNTIYFEIAENFLEILIEDISTNQTIFFYSGLSGIGWGIEYLYQNGFISGNINEILQEIDEKIMELNPQRINDLTLYNGLGGIVCYVLSRLYTIHKENLLNPFDNSFLKDIYDKILIIIDNNLDSDSVDLYIKYITYFQTGLYDEKSSIYDIACLPNYNGDIELSAGMYGIVGMGLKLIFDQELLNLS